jgi:magnesium transporter
VKNQLILPELREYLASGRIDALSHFCEVTPPAVVAELISALEPAEILQILNCAPVTQRASIFSHLDMDLQVEIGVIMPVLDLAHLVDDMPADDRVDLLKQVPAGLHEAVLSCLSRNEREDIWKLSAYKEGTAGSIMTSDHATIPADFSAAEALDLLRREAPDKETIYYTYVIDQGRKLLGFVSLRSLVLAAPDTMIRDIMKTNIVSVEVDADQEDALHIMQKYDLLALPVVNGDGCLAGIITIDDMMDVGEEEVTTDFHRMATVVPLAGSLKEASAWALYRARLPWLLILVFMNVFSGAGIAYFEDTIETVVALVFFLPLLIDSGGNAGSQASTLVVRAMATGDILLRDWFKLVKRETMTCLFLGMSMAVAVIAIAAMRAPHVLTPVAMSMVLIVMFGSLIGTILPFILIRLKLDPATASGPLVTSLADIGGVLIYFGVATWYLALPAG